MNKIRKDLKKLRKNKVIKWFEKREESTFWERAVYKYGCFIRRYIVGNNVYYCRTSLGYLEGKSVAEDFIINSERCAELYVDGVRPKKPDGDREKVATCVRVIQDGQEVVRGREIARNSQRIFIYVRETSKENKIARNPKSYPIRNPIIERVDTEDKPEK